MLEDGFQARTYRLDGLPIHAVVSTRAATAGSPPIVLVHGLGLSGRYMMPVARSLARRYAVYVPDLPGFGDSGKPRRVLDVPGLAESLQAWLVAAGLRDACLLGNSFGCQIIADLAARFHDRIARVVLQGPTAPTDERTWLWQWIRWRQNSPYNPPTLGQIASSDYRKCGRARLFLTFHYSLRDRIEDKLPRIRVPVLVVRGQLDPICNERWAEEVARLAPDGRLVLIPEVAHTLVYTAPRELASATAAFCDEGNG